MNYPTYAPMPMAGYTTPNRPQPRFTQPVTQEMSKMIFAQEDDLSVKISPIEKAKNQCTHKFPGTGQLALVEGNDGKVTCRVCGESFHLILDPSAQIAKTTEDMRDILQSIKTMYLDIPENFVKEYFQLITLLERAPALFEKAANNFKMYDSYNTSPMGVYPGMNSFQQVNGMIGGANMGGIVPQPMYGYNPAQPGYYQQPGYYSQPNGYYNNAPQQGYYQQPVQNPQQTPQQNWPVNAYGQPVPPAPSAYDPSGNPLMYSAPASATAAPPVTGPAPSAGVAPSGNIPVQGPSNPQPQNGEVVQTKSFNV